MTKITIYPLFSNFVEIDNLALYATNNGLTVVGKTTLTTDSVNGQKSATLTLSQTLTLTQQTTITNIFQGTAYITFT